MKMNPEIKARWVAALRSGEYKQAYGELKDKHGRHCCLGVLCDLYAKERGLRRWGAKNLSSLADGEFSVFHRDNAIPGAEVGIWSGLDSHWEVFIGAEKTTLYFHNDDGRTFLAIADAIERQL